MAPSPLLWLAAATGERTGPAIWLAEERVGNPPGGPQRSSYAGRCPVSGCWRAAAGGRPAWRRRPARPSPERALAAPGVRDDGV